MNRGVEKRTLYLEDEDRIRFLALLADVVTHRHWQLVAYVLMSNHYHLLLRTPEPNLSRGMHDLDGDYASSFNVRHDRVGHLFQGRFTSHLVDCDGYLLAVARYIVLNPVRAGLVSCASDWIWSSYPATAGLIRAPAWLDFSLILDRFDADDWNRAKAAYREFVASGDRSSPWQHLVAQMVLGRPEFLQEVEQRVRARERSAEHRRDQRAFRAARLDEVRDAVMGPGSDARAMFVLVAHRGGNASNVEIGRRLGITGAGVGYLLREAEERMKRDAAFAKRVVEIERRLRR